ncbi:uncharacterized protein [Nicotiana sylvestris]|uniref:uncharacterized protein n=1 Tax=Nicotiana sylvestris TaxID=4096 RepID=UPI00388C713A
MALDRERDALDLAETRGQQNQELHVAQEYIKGKILKVATYTSRACRSCQGMTPEQFAEVSLNVVRHISVDLERIYRNESFGVLILVVLPEKVCLIQVWSCLSLWFKTPKFEKYDGHDDPVAHLKKYCNQLRGAAGKEELLMAYFGESLMGVASEWFIDQDFSHWHVWDDMAQAFVKQFQYNIDIAPDRNSLSNMNKKPTESFREYAIKWREQAARVKPPMDNHELIIVFLEAQEPDYFQNMMSAIGRLFAEAIKIGEMVENGLKTGRIVSQAALKATTQAIQNGSGNFANRKKRDEGSMMTFGSRKVQRGASHPYVQVLQGQSSYPQHYYPLPIPQYSVDPPQYTVFNAQSYVRPTDQQIRAPAPRNPRPQQQNFLAPYNARPKQDYGREQRSVERFTPLAELYSSLFQKLKQMGVIGPITPHHMHPDSHRFQANARCEYHSGAPGYSTDGCWTMKKAIERLITEKLIVVTNVEDPPNVTNNPLPAHNDVHFVGMIGRDQEYKLVGQAEMIVRAIHEGTSLEVSPSRDVTLIVKGALSSEKEGAGHNRALHLVVKSDGHYVKRVMVDGGSSVDVCPLSTLQGMKINIDIIQSSNVRIRAFDGSARDTIGEINLTMTIGPVDFEIVFQVVDMDTSYNFLLGRPWINMDRAVPFTLHQMVKFKHDMQEIIVHGEDESSIYKDPLIPCIEAKEGCESIVYQAFEVVSMDHVEEGKPILHHRLSATSIMVAAVMLRQGCELEKGLGASLQGISEPISPFNNQGNFGLGFRPTKAYKNKAEHRKKHGWVLQQSIPHIFYTFVKPRLQEGQNSSVHANIDEICHGLNQMFSEFFNASFNNMTNMRNSRPDHKKLSNIEIMHQEIEYDKDEVVNEIKKRVGTI